MLDSFWSLAAPWLQLLLRLLLAIAVGGLVGLEREIERKPAGLRTHMLVSLGAAIFVMTGSAGSTLEPGTEEYTRIIQGVTTSVGFLGAGEIVSKSRSESSPSDSNAAPISVRGLTSAAAIWVSAALGVAVGCGLWRVALLGALLTLLVLRGVKQFERNID